MPRLSPGRARREFLAAKPEVERRLAEGDTVLDVYAALRKEGKLTMCYNVFRLHVNRAGLRSPRGHGGKSLPPAPALPAQRTETAPKPATPATPAQEQDGQKRKCIIAGGNDDKPAFGRHPMPDWLKELKGK